MATKLTSLTQLQAAVTKCQSKIAEVLKAASDAITEVSNAKADKSHKHAKADITDFPSSMPASDVYAWAKASTKPSYTKSEVGLGSVDNTADANKTVKAANSLNATLLAASTNLNNITTSGFYYCPADATVKTFTNCPTAHALFLEVGRHAGYYQRVTEYMTSGAKTWYRNYYSNAWGSWYRIYSESDKPPDTNTTYSNMTGASTSAAGKAGLVPAPAAGAATRYLRSDGTWQVPPDTNTNTWRGVQNNLTSTATDQSLSAAMGKKLQDEKAAKVATASLTIPNTGWGTDSSVTGYTAYVDVTVSGLTASDVVVVMIAAKSASVADAACLCGACESLAGKLRIRAKHTPTAALSAVYYIVR